MPTTIAGVVRRGVGRVGPVAPGDEHRVVGREADPAVGQRLGPVHRHLHQRPEATVGRRRPVHGRERGDQAPTGSQRVPGGIERVETAAADEHPVGPGQVGEHVGGVTDHHLDDRAQRRGVAHDPLGVVGPALDGDHPQAGRGQRGLDGDAAAARSDVPQDAAVGEVEPAEDDRADLGLGDHPGPVGEVGDRPAAGARRGGGRRRRVGDDEDRAVVVGAGGDGRRGRRP